MKHLSRLIGCLLVSALAPLSAGSATRSAPNVNIPAGRAPPKSTTVSASTRADVTIESFEGSDFAGWTVSGQVFGRQPMRPDRGHTLSSYQGAGVAWSGHARAVGHLLSAPFQMERDYINFLVQGERNPPSMIGVELLIDDRVVRSAAAPDAEDYALRSRTWDVRNLQGKTARLRINDFSPTGTIAVDEFAQSDEPKSTPVDAVAFLQETWRPQFHFTAPAGFLNDPNGLLYYRGDWHLFYQHAAPGKPSKVWGHATSRDLMRWIHHPPAVSMGDDTRPAAGPVELPPGAALKDAYERPQSGSGWVDYGNRSGLGKGGRPPILLFYSRRPPGATTVTDFVATEKVVQEMAYSVDGGATWKKFAGNPILRTPDYRDRDPKVLFHEPTNSWLMVLSLSANNANRDAAAYGLFRSKDLAHWELLQRLGPGAWYWECPDLFELPLDNDPTRSKWLLLNGRGDYILGTLDATGFHAESEPIQTRWGGHYYATQTFNDAPNGRRVQIGWMNTGKEKNPVSYPGMPFNQQMSIPRELTLRGTPAGPRLFRQPVVEVETLRIRTHDIASRQISPGENALAGIHGELLDADLEIDLQEATQVTLNLRGEPLAYDVRARVLRAFGSAAPLRTVDGKLRLRVLLDRTSIEIFGQDGEADFAGVFFPDPANRTLSLTSAGSSIVLRGQVHELKSAWTGLD